MYKKYAVILLVLQLFAITALGFTAEQKTGVSGKDMEQTNETCLQSDMDNDENKKSNEVVDCSLTISGYQPVLEVESIERTDKYSLSEADKLILYKIVEAEAGCEDRIGKILVANVILNRLGNCGFPDTVEAVVFQKEDGIYQFSPIGNGRYDCANPKEETIEAVDSALAGEDYSEGALYFVARAYADSSNMSWFDTRLEKVTEHGGHEFYK